MEHQQKSIKFYHKNGGRIIIGDEWGMGKTVTVLVICMIYKITNVFVICPKVLIPHWQSHFEILKD